MIIHPISHKQTNMYVIGSGERYILYDCLWQDSFPVIRSGLKALGISFSQIAGLLVSHFHPDHAGCCELLRQHGVPLLVIDEQIPHITWLNNFFRQRKNDPEGLYVPLSVDDCKPYSSAAASSFVQSCDIEGQVIVTPGHSADGISFIVGQTAFVGDLPTLDTAEAFGDEVMTSWSTILSTGVTEYYHAHAGYIKLSSPCRPDTDTTFDLISLSQALMNDLLS